MTISSHSFHDEGPPVAYVAIQDAAARSAIVGALACFGWTVIPQPTGFHLIEAIANVIENHDARRQPTLIVIDARSRGCAGTTIAAGLRDLGIMIPIVLVTAPGDAPVITSDHALRLVDRTQVVAAVTELAAVAWPRGRMASHEMACSPTSAGAGEWQSAL